MFGSQILDVAIGLIFIFLMLSLVVTALNELVAAWWKRRSKTLRHGIVRLLGDEGFAQSVYSHPLVSTLSQSSSRQPSYIPSRTFVLAVLDTLTGGNAPPPTTTQEVADALGRLPAHQSSLATSLRALLSDTGGDMEVFKRLLERWFDNAMERVSGWYKRQTQWILLVMAAGVTVWTNADAVVLTNILWRDPALRSALVAQAQEYVQQERKDSAAAASAPRQDGPPPPPAEPPSEAAEYEAASENFQASVDRIGQMGLPLGWNTGEAGAGDERDRFPRTPTAVWSALSRHALGWLLTTLAVSLGAPFWFDMLNKVVSIRSAGKAPDEKEKSPK